MRTTLSGLSLAGAIFLVCCRSAGAIPIDAAVMRGAATVPSPVQQVQFSARRTRHHVIKCYREFVVGPYVCHRFHRWWW
jgi:hypothetical protein